MKWTESHDVSFCREILLIKPYQFKTGSKESGNAWSSIATDLNCFTEISFHVNQKSVRDRFRLLTDKHKKKTRDQEGASGSATDETELDNLLQNITEEAMEAAEHYDKESQDKQGKIVKDRQNAEEVRTKAMESLGQSQKRKKEEEGECSSTSRKKRNTGTETMAYLRSKAEQEFELKKEELKLRKMEMDYRMEAKSTEKETQQAETFSKSLETFQTQQYQMMQQQQLLFNKLIEQQQNAQNAQVQQAQNQQQMNQSLVLLLEKLANK